MRPTNYSICPKCNNAKLPHAACGQCGFVRSDLTLELGTES